MSVVTRLLLLGPALGLAGCATAQVAVDARPDGTKHLACKLPLAECLAEAERVCQGRRYVVLRAVDEHDRRGGPELNLDVRTSEALLRCAPAIGWPKGFDPMALPPEAAGVGAPAALAAAPPPPAEPPPAAAPPAAEPPSPPPVRACFPGSTQACVGPGGCTGGQACLPDASSFGPCDCGGGAADVRRTR
jgi:hypothetical protein